MLKDFKWTASVELQPLDKCEPNGTLLLPNSRNTIFDMSSQTASFNRLRITQHGMYLLLVSVNTINSNEYSFTCVSKPILVKYSKLARLQRAPTHEPNIYLTFEPKSTISSSLSQSNLKIYEATLYNCIIRQNALYLHTPIVFESENTRFALGASGTDESYSQLILGLSNFSLSDELVLQTALVNGQNFTFFNLKQTSEENLKAENMAADDKENAVTILDYFSFVK